MASENKPPLAKRSVVSSFIFKYEDEKPLVALFRRSDEVHTYKHRLAPISGSIDRTDATPLAAAWREINEETTLTPASLALLRLGKSYSFRDESVGREWTIHPFAFLLETTGAGEEDILIDWEHEGWGWYDPLTVEDSEEFGGVPRLAESLRRVWFERDLGLSAGRELEKGLKRLRNDYQSGARELASIALQILCGVISELDAKGARADWWAKVRFSAWHLWKNGRESMGAAILSVLLSALGSIEDISRADEEHPDSMQSTEWRDSALDTLESQVKSRGDSASKFVSEAFAKYLKATFPSRLALQEQISILTLSESSTLSHCLRHLVLKSGISLDLRVLESRPLFEGVSLAGSFSDDLISAHASLQDRRQQERLKVLPKVKISLFSDASAALAAEGVDVVVIGADRIASSGAVSNKTGSLPAILSARHVTASQEDPAKIIVLGESEKIAPPGSSEEHVVEDNDPGQLIRSWNADHNDARVVRGSQAIRGMLKGRSNQAEANQAEAQLLEPQIGGLGSTRGLKVSVHNIFFEWCPGRLIDVYMTEFGQWTVEDILKHSKHLETEQWRFFSNL